VGGREGEIKWSVESGESGVEEISEEIFGAGRTFGERN